MRWGLSAAAFGLLAAYFLNHGIFIGSSAWAQQGTRFKNCRYLFITGTTTMPARGAFGFGYQGEADPDQLYCRLFGD